MADDTLPEADRIGPHAHPRETAHLVGQHRAEQQFLDAWRSGRLHHAWLLRGPSGIGKATLAYRIARALIAQPPEDGLFGAPEIPETLDAQPDCPVQARFIAQSEPRLFVLRREVNDQGRLQTQIAVDRVRAMRGFLQLSAADGGWRAIIVDPADELNTAAANALLKYLEEPPAQTVFLLVCHAPARLLPTIRSRCRTLDLGPLGPPDLAAAMEAHEVDVPNAAEVPLAELSAGSVGRALQLVAGDGLAAYAALVQMLGQGQGVDRRAMMQVADGCAGRNAAERYRLVLDLVLLLIARLARAGASGQVPPEAAPGEGALIARAASQPAQGRLWAEKLSHLSARTRHAVAVNLDPAQVVVDILLEIDATLAQSRTVAA